jgi:hypothetical protein
LSGAIIAFGLQDKASELFEEVQRSNMTKACNDKDEAMVTIKMAKSRKKESCHYVQRGGKFIVLRDSDNKLIKSEFYEPANLKEILEK